jgi:hypothetical protein
VAHIQRIIYAVFVVVCGLHVICGILGKVQYVVSEVCKYITLQSTASRCYID